VKKWEYLDVAFVPNRKNGGPFLITDGVLKREFKHMEEWNRWRSELGFHGFELINVSVRLDEDDVEIFHYFFKRELDPSFKLPSDEPILIQNPNSPRR
jgi:hypothetical protein